LLLVILIERGMLSSVSGLVHPERDGRLDTGSWTVECPRQRINEEPASGSAILRYPSGMQSVGIKIQVVENPRRL
jgi:hypothetical protein